MNYKNNVNHWQHIKELKENQNLVFIHTPKCGGTYVSQILSKLKIKNNHHTQASSNQGITFTVIRDPVKRFESFLNYRLDNKNPRPDWPKHLLYIFRRKKMSLNGIVSKMTDKEILNFKPYRTLEYWSKNIDIFITIDQLKQLLNFFGYSYNEENFSKKNVSKKNRGTFSEETQQRIANIFKKDIELYNNYIENIQ